MPGPLRSPQPFTLAHHRQKHCGSICVSPGLPCISRSTHHLPMPLPNAISVAHGVPSQVQAFEPTARVLLRRDADYGTAGTLLIPGTRLGVSNDKNGVIYVLDLDKLGGFQARVQGQPQGQGWGRRQTTVRVQVRDEMIGPRIDNAALSHRLGCRSPLVCWPIVCRSLHRRRR